MTDRKENISGILIIMGKEGGKNCNKLNQYYVIKSQFSFKYRSILTKIGVRSKDGGEEI